LEDLAKNKSKKYVDEILAAQMGIRSYSEWLIFGDLY